MDREKTLTKIQAEDNTEGTLSPEVIETGTVDEPLPETGELEQEFLRDQDAIADEQALNPEMLAKLQASRRSATDILASLQKQLFILEPRHKWVIIRKIFREETATDTGVRIQAQDRSSLGEVVSVGPEISDIRMGDQVTFSNFAMEVQDCEELTGERDLFQVRDEEVYAVLRAKPR